MNRVRRAQNINFVKLDLEIVLNIEFVFRSVCFKMLRQWDMPRQRHQDRKFFYTNFQQPVLNCFLSSQIKPALYKFGWCWVSSPYMYKYDTIYSLFIWITPIESVTMWHCIDLCRGPWYAVRSKWFSMFDLFSSATLSMGYQAGSSTNTLWVFFSFPVQMHRKALVATRCHCKCGEFDELHAFLRFYETF